MKTKTLVELRGYDGAYVTGRVLDEDRLRVLMSNVFPIGSVVLKNSGLDWSEAVEEEGGVTRLIPEDMVLLAEAGDGYKGGNWDDFMSVFDEGNEVVREAHDALEDRAPLVEAESKEESAGAGRFRFPKAARRAYGRPERGRRVA